MPRKQRANTRTQRTDQRSKSAPPAAKERAPAPSESPRGRPFKPGTSGNPKGRPRRSDGWYSQATGFNDPNRDKRLGASFRTCAMDWNTALDLWRGNWLAAKGIEKLPSEATRAGFKFCPADDGEDETAEASEGASAGVDNASDLKTQVHAMWKRLGLVKKIRRCMEFSRGFGGGGLLLGVNDGSADLSLPLNMKTIRSLDWIMELEAREFRPHWYYTNPLADKCGQVSVWQVTPTGRGIGDPREQGSNLAPMTLVHETRLVYFPGIEVSRYQVSGQNGHGDSILTRLEPVLRDYGMSWDAASALLQDFSQAVYKFKNFAELISKDNGKRFQDRLTNMEMMRSVMRAIAIDSEEDFERKPTPIAGVAEILDRFTDVVAAALDTPKTVLFGMSPAGLSATGESDLTIWHKTVGTEQSEVVIPAMETITAIGLAAMRIEAEGCTIEALPLDVPSAKEDAETKAIIMTTDVGYVNAGIVSPATVAASRWGGPTFGTGMEIDFEAKAAAYAPAPEDIRDPKATSPETPAPAPEINGAAGSDAIQDTTLNGAQIEAILAAVTAVANGQVSRESGIALLQLAVQIPAAEAAKLFGPVGWKPEPPPVKAPPPASVPDKP